MRRNKMILSLLLGALLTLGLCAGITAAEPEYGLMGASDRFGSGGYIKDGTTKRGYIQDFEYLYNTHPGTEIFMPLHNRDFDWDKYSDKPEELNVRANDYLRFDMQITELRGKEAFDTLAVVCRGDQVGILLRFVDSYAELDPLEFELECWLTQGGGQIPDADFVIRGELQNRERSISSSANNVQLGKGCQATALADVSGVKFDLGSGVTLTGDVFQGQTVYGAASYTPQITDKLLMEQYPQISKVLRLDAIGLNGRVRIDTGDEGVFHVYDLERNYLGTTEGPVRFERVYYLSPSKL